MKARTFIVYTTAPDKAISGQKGQRGERAVRKRGSITLEAAIIMPIVLAISIVMIYFVLIYYEKTILSTFCHNYAEGIAKYANAKFTTTSEVNQTEKYFYRNKIAWDVDMSEHSFRYPIYWRQFADYLPNESNLAKKLARRMVFKTDTKLRVEKETKLLSSYIIVTGERRIKRIIPILRVLGINSEGVLIKTRAKVAVVDQPEWIRNINLLQDSVRLFGGGEALREIKTSLKASLQELLQ
ncbi:pilus assembly protein [Clostridiales bacterium COT073_COT-073]|nr:pilus assembly protein [Clostridiales bacterium COT073_COT-073]